MSGRSKGFDPLSNLFDAPSPSAHVEDPAAVSTEPKVDKVALAKKLAADAQAKARAEADVEAEKAALAKKLAAEAQAKAAAEAEASKAALAKKLASEAQAKAAAKETADKAALAKALAKAAMEKNKATRKNPAKSKRRSLAERASTGKKMSALEAARAAAAEEAARKQARSKAKRKEAEQQRAGQAQRAAASTGNLIQKVLGAGVSTDDARIAAQRDLLSALWKAHQQRHVEDGQWVVAGACAAVVDALDRVADGQLAAVPTKAGQDDLLVWVDLARTSIVAVIPNGRTYLAGI